MALDQYHRKHRRAQKLDALDLFEQEDVEEEAFSLCALCLCERTSVDQISVYLCSSVVKTPSTKAIFCP